MHSYPTSIRRIVSFIKSYTLHTLRRFKCLPQTCSFLMRFKVQHDKKDLKRNFFGLNRAEGLPHTEWTYAPSVTDS